MLEGWAIVDNTTGEDWTKVQLSLVSGRPISFISQLYAPRYVTRPTAELADDSRGAAGGACGRVRGAGTKAAAGRRPAAASAADGPLKARAPAAGAAATMAADASGCDASASLPAPSRPTAAGRELGELFEYRIAQPVTIRKNESAMLPFLQQTIDARKLLIYSDHSSQHPTNAAELTNSTGKTLDGGPITVYDARRLRRRSADGNAQGRRQAAHQLRRRSGHAHHRGLRQQGSQSSARSTPAAASLTTKFAAEETRTYTIRNVDQKAKTLIIEHPLRPGYTLLNQKPTEKTATAYRFEVTLAAGATQEFAVTEERVYDQSIAVTNLTPDVLVSYLQNRTLSDAGRRQLQRIADQKRQIAENDRALQDVDAQMRDLTADEDRIRRNIQSLNNVSGQQQQVQTYARQLDTQEQQLAALRDRQAELQKKKIGAAGRAGQAGGGADVLRHYGRG